MIFIFASGTGSNYEVLAKNFSSKIGALITNNKSAGAINVSLKYNIPCYIIPHNQYKNRQEHEKEILKKLNLEYNLKKNDLIILAGYMRVLSPYFINNCKCPIINLHPAHLDQYKGANAYQYALENKYPRWGISIHNVTKELDSGKLISSKESYIFPYENILTLKNRFQKLEHELVTKTVLAYLQTQGNIEE
jgi:phosphoribosylglycinamide formyltransferase-1